MKERWIMVFSEKAFMREEKTLEKKIEKEKEQVEKELWHFSNQDFYSAEDGLKALRKLEKRWKYHKVKWIEVVERRKRKGGGRGRPRNGEELQRFYHIKTGFEEDEGVIRKEMLRKGNCGVEPHNPENPVGVYSSLLQTS